MGLLPRQPQFEVVIALPEQNLQDHSGTETRATLLSWDVLMPFPFCASCDFRDSPVGFCGRWSTFYFLIGFANRFFVLALWGTRIPDETRSSASASGIVRVPTLPFCGIPLRTGDMLARNPDSAAPRASRTRRRTPGRSLRRRRKHVPRSPSRLPSGARPWRRRSRRRDPARCSAPSSSHPARAGTPSRNARRRPCIRCRRRYSFDTFRVAYSVSNRANA